MKSRLRAGCFSRQFTQALAPFQLEWQVLVLFWFNTDRVRNKFEIIFQGNKRKMIYSIPDTCFSISILKSDENFSNVLKFLKRYIIEY